MNAIKMGMTIEEAAETSGIGRNTMRKLVDWGKPPFYVLSYADFVSFSGAAGSIFASRKAFFRAPCLLICAA